jgi:hypothetical protein
MASSKPTSKKEGGIDLKSDSASITGREVAGRDNIKGFSGKEVNLLMETLLKYFDKGYLQDPAKLGNTLSDFRTYHEKLHEYKELHNAVNEIQIDFEQFKAEIDRATFTRSISKLSTLRKLWRPVSLKITALLKWSQTIQSIGKPFKILEDKSRSGEEWAIQFSGLQSRMNEHLGMDEQTGETSKKEAEYPNQMQIIAYQSLGRDLAWWETLSELTSEFQHTWSHHMNAADKQLRETAQELYNLSNKALSNI